MQTLFYILFFFVPLVLWPYTSELFEFNKMIFVYAMTATIVAAWLSRCLVTKKFIFRRTILDIPLLVFLASQLLSTILSVDIRTSIFGYYSRFNGGLLSVISYSLLYWAFVSNMDRRHALRTMNFVLWSTAIVCLYGIAEHFGIDKNLWVQDVQNRVFSTLGQPNWLATFLVALMPLVWCNSISKKRLLWLGLSVLLFTTLLFTKSRSGFLGFITADIIFWVGAFLIYKKSVLKTCIVLNSLFIALALLIGFPFSLITNHRSPITSSAPALEVGGTESGQIRKIVWKGALQVWHHYPVFGSGVETFAYSYYQFRPVEHNLVSEWDFLYNKAHNEYLNLAATTGTVGLVSYLVLISFAIYQLWKLKEIALLSGYGSILVSNFFGFSVVPTQLLLFLFPAFAVTLGVSGQGIADSPKIKLSTNQKILLVFTLFVTSYSLYAICKYWYADLLYAKGDAPSLTRAVKISPKEAIFHNDLATVYTNIALSLKQDKEAEKANVFVSLAITESNRARELSPANLNVLRSRASLFISLAAIDKKYLGSAKDALLTALDKAPTDAKILYNLALVYLKTGETEAAVNALQKTVEMKPNYQEAKRWLDLLEKSK